MRVGDFLAATDIYSSQVKKPRDLVIIFKSNGIIYHFNAVSIYRYTYTHLYRCTLHADIHHADINQMGCN